MGAVRGRIIKSLQTWAQWFVPYGLVYETHPPFLRKLSINKMFASHTGEGMCHGFRGTSGECWVGCVFLLGAADVQLNTVCLSADFDANRKQEFWGNEAMLKLNVGFVLCSGNRVGLDAILGMVALNLRQSDRPQTNPPSSQDLPVGQVPDVCTSATRPFSKRVFHQWLMLPKTRRHMLVGTLSRMFCLPWQVTGAYDGDFDGIL